MHVDQLRYSIGSTDSQLEASFSDAHSICPRRSWPMYWVVPLLADLRVHSHALLEFKPDTSESRPDWAGPWF